MASHPDTGPRSPRLTRLLMLSSVLLLQAVLTVSHAQISLDGSLGPRGPLTGPNYRIGADVGQIRGGNLFHSFGEFNVPTGGSATFTGPQTIANILSRVTGGQPSSIDGLLRSEIAGANLYLLNPSGVLFGPNASLDVSGSFHVSTADFLRLADGATFFANLGQESVLTVASPTAFGFLGNNPAAITIQGSSLHVAEGKAVSVVGGESRCGQTVMAGRDAERPARPDPARQCSLAGGGGVQPFGAGAGSAARFFYALGRLTLSQGALVDASGNGGGTVLLRGSQLRVDRSNIFADNTGPVDGTGLGMDLQIAADAVLANGSRITVDRLGGGRAGDVRLTVGRLHVDDAVIGSGISASGHGGNVTVQGGQLTLTNGAQIRSSTFGPGTAGAVTVQAEHLVLAGAGASRIAGIVSAAEAGSTGDAGAVVVRADRLVLDGLEAPGVMGIGTLANPGSRGNAADTRVLARDLEVRNGGFISSSTFGPGTAGAVTVQAERLVLTGAGTTITGIMSLANAGSTGAAGVVNVHADRLVIDGRGAAGLTGIGSLANRGSRGNAGDTRVLARDLEVRNGGFIGSSTFGSGQGGTVTVQAERLVLAGIGESSFPGLPFDPTTIASAALPGATGTAGDIHVIADTLELRSGGVISSTTHSLGNAGTIVVDARRLLIDGGEAPVFTAIASTAGIGASAGGTTGAAGNIRVTAGALEIHGGGAITSATFTAGNAGTVTVQADRLVIAGVGTFVAPGAEAPFPSRIESSAEPRATGAGGAVQITAHTLVLTDHGTIAARSVSPQGNAGDITLRVEGPLELRGGALITTEASQAAAGGNLTLTAQGWVRLQDGSAITASVGGGAETVGGNLTLRAPWIILEGSRLVANAFEGMEGGSRSMPWRCWPTPPVASRPRRNGASPALWTSGRR